MTEEGLAERLRQAGFDSCVVWRLTREVRLRQVCDISRTKCDPVGRILRDLGILPAEIEFDSRYTWGRRRRTTRRGRAPILRSVKIRPCPPYFGR